MPEMVDVVAIAMMEAEDVFPLQILLPQELLDDDEDDDNDDTTMMVVPKMVADGMMPRMSRAYQQFHDDPK